MFFYEYNKNFLISKYNYNEFTQIPERNIESAEHIFVLNKLPLEASRRSFSVGDENFMFIDKEDLNIIEKPLINENNVPEWLLTKIKYRRVKAINTTYIDWKEALKIEENRKWRVNVVGLGDVGSTLITGLRLLGSDCISQIGIFDLDGNKINRIMYEGNQIYDAFTTKSFPDIIALTENNIFDCDLFVFCVTTGVPELGSKIKDVRLYQYEGNRKIINHYAKLSRFHHFGGIFAVVSDPVDQLCKAALTSSNVNENNIYDGLGLKPDQIHGYGLGVMNARAVYYSKENAVAPYYETLGRAYGPHGDGLVIADNINNYDDELSIILTDKAKNANLIIRETGYKPYIAPALSSGSLSIISTIKGEWHYSSSFMGNAFIGAKNRINSTGIEVEQVILAPQLKSRLLSTYERLCEY